jgi:hypothetical protein
LFQNCILQGDDDNNNSMVDKKRHRSEAEEWHFRLMNDPKQFEKERYIDSINVYNSIIEEFQKLYHKTPATDHLTRAKILNRMKQSKRDLTKIRPNTRCSKNTRPELQ